MRILFVKSEFPWPPASGQDVHSRQMMRALIDLGCEVSLTSLVEPHPEALSGLDLTSVSIFEATDGTQVPPKPVLSNLQERFRSYWGIDRGHVTFVGAEAKRCQAEATVLVGLEILPYLGALDGSVRVWYAADEWVWHHLSLLQMADPRTWANLRPAAVKGLYEWAYASLMDRVWVVSPGDQRAMKRVTGLKKVDLIPNGVDTGHFQPQASTQQKNTCVFWGRLDFDPNVQALEWFCRQVWPSIRRRHPDAEFRVFGFNQTARVEALRRLDGVSVTPDLPDIRQAIGESQVSVFPFQSGGGVKNKLLEAAGLAMPIVCTRRVCDGLDLPDDPPLIVLDDARAWIGAIESLWADDRRRLELGESARHWVTEKHSWKGSAQLALASLQSVT